MTTWAEAWTGVGYRGEPYGVRVSLGAWQTLIELPCRTKMDVRRAIVAARMRYPGRRVSAFRYETTRVGSIEGAKIFDTGLRFRHLVDIPPMNELEVER